MAPIAHLDIDAFYASVELQRRPELRGLPVIVSGSGPRAVVTTASYEARQFGIGSAMPTARARRLCPQAVLVPPDFTAYKAASQTVMDLVRGAVDRVEVVGLDEAYLDLDGLMSPKAAMRRLVADIRAASGLTASVGIGPNKLVAKVASDAEKPAGFVVLSREQACERFAASPPGLVPGIGPKTVERLTRLGITTLGQLGAAPEALLVEHFGANSGPELRRRAQFHGSPDVTTHRLVVSESRETTFDRDVGDALELEGRLAQLAQELSARLVKQDRRGRTIAIKVRLDDWTTVTRARTIAAPTNDAGVLAGVALELLREYAPARPVRLLGVRVAAFDHHEPAGDTSQLALPVTTSCAMAHATIDGREIHYVQRGEGEPLLLIQGMSGSHLSWGDPFRAELERDFALTAYDHRGIGRSSRVENEPFTIGDLAEDAAALLDAIGVERAHVLGISMGGMVAQELALRHPQRLTTLTLGCTSSGGEGATRTRPEVFGRLSQAMLSGDRERALRAGYDVNVSAAFAADEEQWTAFRAMATQLPAPVPVIMAQVQAIGGHDVLERLGALTAPTLVIHGDEDQMLDVANGRLIASRIPGARLEVLEGVGHMFWWERPQQSAELIRSHALAAAAG